MNVPPFLIGGALLFWGVETGNLLVGLVLAVLLEGNNFVAVRYDLDEEDFIKVSDLTSLIFLGAIALILLNYEPLGFLRITVGWMPAILAPLMMAQLYSTGDVVIIGTRLGKKKKSYAHKPIDLRFYYLLHCIFAAACSNSRSMFFFSAVCLIFAILFFFNRGRAYSSIFFVTFFLAALMLAFSSNALMEKTHHFVMDQSHRFMRNYYWEKHSDPFKVNVSFGDTGRAKSSGKIVMRVESGNSSPPRLFKLANYDTFTKNSWFGNQQGYEFVTPLDQENWNLMDPPHKNRSSSQVEYNLPKEKGMLPAPNGSVHLRSATIYELEQNRSGNNRVEDGAPIVSYEISYEQNRRNKRDLPSARNLEIPEDEKYALDMLQAQFNVRSGSDLEKITAVREHFLRGYSYSLSLVGSGEYTTPLGNFLLQKKSGFCEYYATATVLLLRKLGVPSRYAIGYAVSEKSALEGKYIVRQRHSHAWAEAFVNDSWVTVDTTPPDWFAFDGKNASSLEPIQDFFNFLRHKYKLFQIGTGEDYTLVFSMIVVVLTTFLVIRIYRRMRLEKAGEDNEEHVERIFERIISPLTPLIDHVEDSQLPRDPGESYSEWAGRLYGWGSREIDTFRRLYALHLKTRFDPEGIEEDERDFLSRGSADLLEGSKKDHYVAVMEE